MTVKQYKAVQGARGLSDADAARIGSFLDSKFGEEGPRDPEDVLRVARPARSPIHRDFEWDDAKAAEAHRITQAEYILRSVAIVYVTDGVEEYTRAFQRVTILTDDGVKTTYVPAQVVWSDPNYSAEVVARAKRDLVAWANRYRQYKGLADLVGGIDDLLAGDDDD